MSIELARNENYWKEGLPYIDGIIHHYIADKGTAIGAYRTQQVLMTTFPVTNLSNTEILELEEAEADILDVYLIPNTSLLGTLINTTIEPFNDVRVRRAMHLAVDRAEFRTIFGGGIAPVGTPFPPDTWFGRTEGRSPPTPRFPERGRRQQAPGRHRRGQEVAG